MLGILFSVNRDGEGVKGPENISPWGVTIDRDLEIQKWMTTGIIKVHVHVYIHATCMYVPRVPLFLVEPGTS